MVTNLFSNQGYQDLNNLNFRVFQWGQSLGSGNFDIWMVDNNYVLPPATSPLPNKIISGYTPGSTISIPTDTAGVFLLTIAKQGSSAADIAKASGSLITFPLISCRILPNYEYNQFYTFDAQGEPKFANPIDWDALFHHVFRNYYLLYPGMSKILPLDQPKQWRSASLGILIDRVSEASWGQAKYMPRTRDLSATRRWLVLAYCQKYIHAGN